MWANLSRLGLSFVLDCCPQRAALARALRRPAGLVAGELLIAALKAKAAAVGKGVFLGPCSVRDKA